MSYSFIHIFQTPYSLQNYKICVCISWNTAKQITHYVTCGYAIRIIVYLSDQFLCFMRLISCCSLYSKHTVDLFSEVSYFNFVFTSLVL